MKSAPLYNQLLDHYNQRIYPFHMPGHKQKILPFDKLIHMDFTEIDGLDNLHAPNDVIRESELQASKLYGAEKTFFLVNGSTVGILAAIMGLTKKGDKVLVARNCHKSVYHAILMHELTPYYIYPNMIEDYGVAGGISPEEVDRILSAHSDIKLMIITSPTYEGIVSDIEAISKKAQKYKIPLLVDEAHGAHFNFSPMLPESAIKLGADVVVHSLHKTLPSLTQTALLHIKDEKKIEGHSINQYLKMLQTSSPSYIFMASMDYCLAWMDAFGEQVIEELLDKHKAFRDRKNHFLPLMLMGEEVMTTHEVFDLDKSKLLFYTGNTGLTGVSIDKILRRDYHIQVELSSKWYFLALTTIGDDYKGFEKLYQALLEIKERFKVGEKSTDIYFNNTLTPAYSPYEINGKMLEKISLNQSINRISAEFIIPYPPGVPLVVPGEIISKEILQLIQSYQLTGVDLMGMEDQALKKIKVVKEVS